MANELVIPPDILPEQPSRIELVDDQTFSFRPQFGRAWSQRNSFGDPRWRLKHRFRGLRQRDIGRMHIIASEAQGGFRTIMVSPAMANRGSFTTTYSTELFANASPPSGTTSWSTQGDMSVSESQGVLRGTLTGITSVPAIYQSVTVTAYSPYCLRAVLKEGQGLSGISAGSFLYNTSNYTTTARGYYVTTDVPLTTPVSAFPLVIAGSSGFQALAYMDVLFASIARCGQVDGAGNLLLQSDDITTTWANTRSTDSANTTTAPDGTSTADSLIEDATASNSHFISQSVTIASAALDYAFSVAVKANTRTAVAVQLMEGTGSTTASIDVNLSTGALSGTLTGANWSNVRTFSQSLGSGWYLVSLVARKTNAATTLTARLAMENPLGSTSYNGDGSSSIYVWRPTLTQSAVPSRLTATTSAAVAADAVAQNSSTLYLKGLPASVTGLMLAGDWFEVDGQLKRLTADLNTDAQGMGFAQFRPKLARAVTNNTPVIVTKPMGRFTLADDVGFDAMFGLYADYDLTFDEVYE